MERSNDFPAVITFFDDWFIVNPKHVRVVGMKNGITKIELASDEKRVMIYTQDVHHVLSILYDLIRSEPGVHKLERYLSGYCVPEEWYEEDPDEDEADDDEDDDDEDDDEEEAREIWRARIKNPYFKNSQGGLDPLTQTRGIIIATYMDARKEMIERQQNARYRAEMLKFWNEHADWATEYEAGWEDGYYAAMNDVVDDIERMITDYKDWVKKSEERERQLDTQCEECSEDGG